MTKETLIKQLSTEVRGACACDKMRKAARKITRRYNEALKPAGIKVTQFTILAAICVKEGATLTDLSSHVGMERTTFLRNLKPLESQALIKTTDDGVGRARSAKLTDKGVIVMEKALPLWRRAQRALRKQVGDDMWARVQEELAAFGQLA